MIALSPAIMADLQARHAEPHRAYHNWQHISALLRWAQSGEFALHDPASVDCAILFHDAIYDPKSTENEELSAQLAEASLAAVVPSEMLAFVATMIRATAKHHMPDGLSVSQSHDAAHFLDMDLSILGADPRVFAVYEENIRSEYAHVSEAVFLPARSAVLSRFRDRERLYFSDWGYARFEEQARQNLDSSIAAALSRT
jgi:predicted metal-dependent HD superfamily phosphohydrolase